MCFFLQDDLKSPDFSLPNTAFLALMYQSIKTIYDKGFQAILQLFTLSQFHVKFGSHGGSEVSVQSTISR
jgi:hypothetical protein